MARIGLIVPSSNTVMEPDFAHAFQGIATVHSARMFLEDPVTVEGELRMLDEYARPAARDLATLNPDLVVFGCTSAGALRGEAADIALRKTLSEIAGAPVVGVIDSIAQSLLAMGAHRVSLLTPYVDTLTSAVGRSLATAGFDVRRTTGLGIANNRAIGDVSPDVVLDAAADSVSLDSEALVVACTNFRAYEVRDAVMIRTGVGVVTACSSVIDSVKHVLDELR